jgi:hypothetical protein
MLKDWGLTVGGLANMVNDAKMDVVKIPNFSQNMATKEYSDKVLGRFMMANQSKSTINTLLLDKEEEWNRIQTNLSGSPNLLREMMTIMAGAADIPVSRLLGQAAGRGLSSSSSGGEQDLRNYYDGISSRQKTLYSPILAPLDQVIMRSALGKYDPNIYYEWAPLWQMDEEKKATIQLTKAQTTQVYVTTGLINEDALRDATVNQLIEDGAYAGLEDAIDKYGAEPDIPESRVWSPGVDPVTGKPIAAPAPGGGGGGSNPAAPKPPAKESGAA